MSEVLLCMPYFFVLSNPSSELVGEGTNGVTAMALKSNNDNRNNNNKNSRASS